MKLELDLKELTVTLGKWKFDCVKGKIPKCSKNGVYTKDHFYAFIQNVAQANGIKNAFSPKTLYQSFRETHQMTPKFFAMQLRKLQYKAWVDGLNSKVLWATYRTGHYRGKRLYLGNEFRHVKPLLIQAVKDGQDNIVPIIAAFKKPPQELKRELGKGAWKKLYKNSLTRNALIAKYSNNIEGIKIGLELSSSLLKVTGICHSQYPELPKAWDRVAREQRVLTKPQLHQKIRHVLYDTVYIAEQLGECVNLNWSYRTWKEKHEEFTKKLNEKRYSPDPIKATEYQFLQKEFSCDEGVATLLDSPLLIAQEGNRMGHCVAGYVPYCTKGGYAVYHVVDKDGKESTLGVYVIQKELIKLMNEKYKVSKVEIKAQQHYSFYNDPISPSAKVIQEKLVTHQNTVHDS